MWRVLLALVVAAACGRSGIPVSHPALRPSSDVVTQTELERTMAPNLYDALRIERPSWITGARAVRNIFIMDHWFGTPVLLRDLSSRSAVSVSLLSETDVVIRYGSRFGGRGLVVVLCAQ